MGVSSHEDRATNRNASLGQEGISLLCLPLKSVVYRTSILFSTSFPCVLSYPLLAW